MSLIRIITNKVMQEAVRINYSAMRVQAAGAVVRLSGLTARTYERNSFGPKIRSICAEADSTAGDLSRWLVGLNIRLSLITGGFIAADIAFLKNLIGTIIGKLPPIDDGGGRPSQATKTEEESEFGKLLKEAAEERKESASASIINDESAGISQNYSDTHKAIDISAKKGTAIFGSMAGTVAFSSDINCGQLPVSSKVTESKNSKTNYGYGNEMIVEYQYDNQPPEVQKQLNENYGLKSGQSLYVQYAHLEHGSLTEAGTEIKAGTQIAEVGNSGVSTGPHVHLAAKVGDSGLISATDNHGTNGWANNSLTSVNPAEMNSLKPAN